jgi:hypothetical protein
MLRSLPPVSRLIFAILLTFITTIILFKSLSPSRSNQSAFCNDSNQCSAEELIRPLSRQEFVSLERKVNLLSQDIEALKQEPPKQLTPDQIQWENKRSECGEGVVRNIDYQHVPPTQSPLFIVERITRKILGSSIETILDPGNPKLESLHR